MSADAAPLTLAADFPAATEAQWRALVEGALKGRPFERLTTRSYDGIALAPLYAPARGAQPVAGRAAGVPWEITQRVDLPDPAAANAEALHELQNGASGLTLVFAGAPGANGFGLPGTPGTLARVLEGVHLDAGIGVTLDLPADGLAVAQEMAALVAARGHDPAAVTVRFGFDPLSGSAETFAGEIATLAAGGFAGPLAAADGRAVHAAGGSEAQELAFALASAVGLLRALEAAGMPLMQAGGQVFFRLAADADEFLTIAKFRALRKLWARVRAACGLTPAPVFVAAETAWRMMTRRDPYVNMLRATVAVFSAAVGGADAITVLPYTAALGLPDRFARRVARNTQLVLAEEAHLAKVSDPAAGAGAIEAATDALCEEAWALFQEIERAGGLAAAFAEGGFATKVAATRAAREIAVAHRREPITGASEFPLLSEPPAAVLVPAPAEASGVPAALSPMRVSAPFERLRDRSDAMLAANGIRPRVFLANLGGAADFMARATFAKNFFEAGGIEAVGNDGFVGGAAAGEPAVGGATDLGALVAAYRASQAPFACLCSSDARYGAEALAAAKALAAAGASHIYLAGRGGEAEAALKAAGIGTFIYAGCNVLATLEAAHDMLPPRS